MALASSLAAAQDVRTVTIPAQPAPSVPLRDASGTTPQARAAAAAAAMEDEESAEKIAEEAQRDLRESRFYNRPGATRAQYNEEWQTCRLIARGSRTPTGGMTYVYNPALVSPLAAGIGAGIGAAIAQAIIEARMRRVNRRACLLIRGWRLIEVDDAEKARIAAMSDAAREAFFNSIVGANEVGGRRVRTWNNDFAAPRLAAAQGE
ncbi:MAG TPA: hypothetical protein VGB08_11490 [Allosphingosinicella sp.]